MGNCVCVGQVGQIQEIQELRKEIGKPKMREDNAVLRKDIDTLRQEIEELRNEIGKTKIIEFK